MRRVTASCASMAEAICTVLLHENPCRRRDIVMSITTVNVDRTLRIWSSSGSIRNEAVEARPCDRVGMDRRIESANYEANSIVPLVADGASASQSCLKARQVRYHLNKFHN